MKEMKIKGRVIYWADPMLSCLSETIEDEWKYYQKQIESNGILFENKVECVDIPPYKIYFDILFFDWGGMTWGCLDTVKSLFNWVLDKSIDNPNKQFVICSTFSKNIMEKEIIEKLKNIEEKPANLFLSIDEWIDKEKKVK